MSPVERVRAYAEHARVARERAARRAKQAAAHHNMARIAGVQAAEASARVNELRRELFR
ncbi:hypothetical protein ACQP2X_27940 [Actinoplanes sp. CA-131856]